MAMQNQKIVRTQMMHEKLHMQERNETELVKLSFCISVGNNQKCTNSKDVWFKK